MRFENTEVFNFEGAIRGMRNPKNSWDRSEISYDKKGNIILCDNDIKLMQTLIKAGSEHRKFMRQIFISTDVIMPAYVAQEFDTYKVGSTRNSCSFQHKGTSKPFELSDFQTSPRDEGYIKLVLPILNDLRDKYLETKDYEYFLSIRRLLPMGYLYRFTWTGNYENILNMYRQRKNHKLADWSTDFVNWVKTLPYAEELLTI